MFWKSLHVSCIVMLCILTTGCNNKETATPEPTSSENSELSQTIDELLANPLLVPLTDMPIPEDNPMNEDVLKLGQILFFDPRLSGNNERSCMSCHIPEVGYGDAQRTLRKIDGTNGERNTPTIINSGFYSSNFWDGRAASLEEQALGPIQNPDEMNQDLDELVKELNAIDGYPALFKKAFGDNAVISPETIGKAIATFERQIFSGETAFDRFLKGDRSALTDEEIRGLNLFAGKAKCIICHQGPALTDNKFHNIGLENDDEGRKAVTGAAEDLGAMRTASLYNLRETAPYFSDGSADSLFHVVDYYNRGGDNHPNKSSLITPLNLTLEEQSNLISFLFSLTGEVKIFQSPELPGETE